MTGLVLEFLFKIFLGGVKGLWTHGLDLAKLPYTAPAGMCEELVRTFIVKELETIELTGCQERDNRYAQMRIDTLLLLPPMLVWFKEASKMTPSSSVKTFAAPMNINQNRC